MAMDPRHVDRACVGLLVVLAGVLATTGGVPMIDHTTHRVLDMVDPIPWSEALRPFWNPEPMLAWALRPLSVVLLKLYADIFGAFTLPPTWLLRLKIGLSALAFGFAARAFLRAWGFRNAASLAAVSTVALAPNQFSMFLLPELDTVGAAATLAGGALLARRGPLGWRWALAVPLVAFSLFLKESSGLAQFAFLIAGAMVSWFRGYKSRALRHGGLILAGAGVWAWLVSGTLQAGSKSMMREMTWLDRLPIAEHNSAQILSFVGIPGVALLVLGAASPALSRRGARVLAGALLCTLAILPLLPSLVWHDHFAAYYFSPRWLATGGGIVMWGALGVLGWRARKAGRLAALAVAGPVAAVTLALLVAASPREDLASRLFLASAPLLHALVWQAALRLWAALDGVRWGRVALGALTACFVWWPTSWALNYNLEFRAAMSVDAPTRHRLAAQDLQDHVVLFNHMVLWLDDMELRAAGGAETLADRTWFVHIPDWIVADELPEADWGQGRMVLEGMWRSGVPMWMVWSSGRPEALPDDARADLGGDFAWTRRPVGVFTTLNHSPGDRVVDEMERTVLPEHNRIEDARMTRYRAAPTPLEALVSERSEELWIFTSRYGQVAPELAQVPWRVLTGVPLLERWAYTSRVSRFQPPDGVSGQGERASVQAWLPRGPSSSVPPPSPDPAQKASRLPPPPAQDPLCSCRTPDGGTTRKPCPPEPSRTEERCEPSP